MGVELPDAELMRRVREGEVEWLGRLFERHHLRLYRFFLRSTGRRGASEDLVQEVFVRMLKYSKTYRDEGEFLPWMYTLARNAASDHYRQTMRQPLAQAELGEPRSLAPLASESMETSERERQVQQALARLPADRREVLVLSKFERRPYQEIATTLGCTVGAVKVRVHRALKELAVVLRQDTQGSLA
jgi:RNA polymerase sigma factor (sigma-70 family)